MGSIKPQAEPLALQAKKCSTRICSEDRRARKAGRFTRKLSAGSKKDDLDTTPR
jgi:hypothetical protein